MDRTVYKTAFFKWQGLEDVGMVVLDPWTYLPDYPSDNPNVAVPESMTTPFEMAVAQAYRLLHS